MKRHGPLLVLACALAALIAGMALLFRLRLAQGDVFPAYSSLRADPLGTRALHDALAQLPDLSVGRHLQPLASLASQPARTILVAGTPPETWTHFTRDEFDALDGAVRTGSRLVIAIKAESAFDRDERERREAARKERTPPPSEREKRTPPPVPSADLHLRWGVDLKERLLMQRGADVAVRTPDAAATLPENVPSRSDVYFVPEASAGWRILYRRGGEPVLIERALGRGSLVLAADSYFLSNEALQRDRAPTLLAWIVGPHCTVEFEEGHFGLVADPGVAALARHYGLEGAFFTLLLLAALFVWRRTATFVPPAPESRDLALAYHPAAGLEALLRRAVPARSLTETCLAEWHATARPADRARVEAALAAAGGASPVARYNAAVRALRRR